MCYYDIYPDETGKDELGFLSLVMCYYDMVEMEGFICRLNFNWWQIATVIIFGDWGFSSKNSIWIAIWFLAVYSKMANFYLKISHF